VVDLVLMSNFGMMSLVIGTIPSIIAAIRNKKNLEGFSLIGALGILTGQTVFLFYFLLLQDIITSVLTLPLISFWAIVIFYKLKTKFRRN